MSELGWPHPAILSSDLGWPRAARDTALHDSADGVVGAETDTLTTDEMAKKKNKKKDKKRRREAEAASAATSGAQAHDTPSVELEESETAGTTTGTAWSDPPADPRRADRDLAERDQKAGVDEEVVPRRARPENDGVSRETSVAEGHRPAVEADTGPDEHQAVSRETSVDNDVKLDERPTEEPTERRTVSRETFPRPGRPPRIVVVANQKGGVGKTTTAVNVAAALAQGGLRVLVIDLDPQGNASTALGVEHGPDVPGTYEAIIDGEDIAGLLQRSPEADSLDVLPASVHLAGAEIRLVGMVARENRLAKAIRRYVRDHEVDYVFLDCPPSLGLLTVNALVAAQEIMIPIQCEYYALEGVSQLMNTIDLVKGELNDDLRLSTVLLTMFDARTRLAAQVVDEVRTHFSAETLAAVIPRSVRISEAPSYGRTVMTYDPESTGARRYHEAAAEIARRGAPS